MKVSAVKAILTEEDLLSIIEDFVEVEGLVISEIKIEELITVKGSYKKGIKVPFKAKLGIGNVCDNIINIRIFNVNVMKLGILNGIKNFALKTFLKDFSEYGINVDKDSLALDMNLIMKLIPYVCFKLKSVKIVEGGLEVEAQELTYAKNKETVSIKKKEKEKPKVQDGYYNFRKNIEKNVPDKYQKVVEYAMLVPDITALLWRLYRDKRVDMKVKIKLIGVIAYLASPIDILPDFIPFIGKIDDVAVAFFGLDAIMNEVPQDIILENWQGEGNILLIIKDGVNYISKVVGTQNVARLIEFIKNSFKKKEVAEKKTEEKKVNEEC